ncbi:hypothetical protein [Thermomonospora amylolytica]|uniref:hypothetical protein n=1 Tax=Thermomonospora amylolytica TaxID=1411117 RepID=UPI000E6D3B95|nr:hypothetical protein [Thermomonospora amylolytica]
MSSPHADPLGYQEPRIRHVPPRVSSAGQEAVELAAAAGLELDPWQQLALDDALGEREDGKWAAFEVGIVVSRQNGKGGLIEARELAGLFLFGERLIIHSAHLFDTSMEAMTRLLTLFEQTPDLERHIKRVSRSHGEEGIELFGGRRVKFKTRTKGGGRGLSGDCVIADEAMYLPSPTVAALMPTMSARPNPQIWYLGSAGEKESVHLGRVRARGLKGLDPRLCYLEWSIDPCDEFCPPGCTEHDPTTIRDEHRLPALELERQRARLVESYRKANPALGIRITVEHIESERRSMDPADFARERLGVGDWPVEGEAWRVISEDAWTALIDTASQPAADSPLVFSLAVARDGSYGCIGVTGRRYDGLVHSEITADDEQLDYRPGTGWMVPRAAELHERWKPAAFVVDAGGPAGALIPRLEEAGVTVVSPSTREYAQACGALYQAIVPREGNTPYVRHRDQAPLNAAVAGADTRKLADLWAWSRASSAVDISPLEMMTLGTWGLTKFGKAKAKPAPWAAYR